MIEVFKRHAPIEGPHLLILGAVHGNEKCGTQALQKIISEIDTGELKLKIGELTLIPICNPKAYELNKRFVEENLNRVMFRSENPTVYERQLANEICPHIELCDYLLDLHSMQAQGEAFSVLNFYRLESVAFCEALQADKMLEGWPEVFSEHPEVLACCTQTYADRFNIPNALIECGSHEDVEAVNVAYRAICSALLYLGMVNKADLKTEVPKKVSEKIVLKEVIFRESMIDVFAKDWKNFEPINKGEAIWIKSDGTPVLAKSNGLIVFPNSKSPAGVEWYFWAPV